MNNKKYELRSKKHEKKIDVLMKLLKRYITSLTESLTVSNGVIDVERNHLQGIGNFYSFFYRENFFSEYQTPILYVSENEGVIELHTYNLPVEAQMDFLSVVVELEEYFVLVRLEGLEK